MIPAKADPEVQAAYLEQEMEPRLAEAQAGRRAIYTSRGHKVRFRKALKT